MAKTVQIRDLDDATYTVLRTRAAAENLSLAAYLRRELDRLASGPSMAEWLDRVDRDIPKIDLSPGDAATAVHEARQERAEHLDLLWAR